MMILIKKFLSQSQWLAQQTMTLLVLLALACLSLGQFTACSFVEFEPSPYAPRNLEAIYSEQEDLTFIFWQIDESADVEKVSFEYFDPNVELWKPIDLGRAIYPASPYACGARTCFQYQLPGYVQWAESSADYEGQGRVGNRFERGVRSIHEDGVSFGALDLRQRKTMTTFGMEPIAIKKNLEFRLNRFDYFETVDLLLKRGYEWRLTPSTATTRAEHIKENCLAGSGAWTSTATAILPVGWTGRSHCLELRPKTSVISPVTVVEPLPPSAILKPMEMSYSPPLSNPLTFFFSLNDLLIRSNRRCAQLQTEIVDTVRGYFKSRTPTDKQVDLGDWYPVTPIGRMNDESCEHAFDRVYPVTELIDSIKQEILLRGSNDQVIIGIYSNNSDEPVPDQVKRDLEQMMSELFALPNTRPFLIVVADSGLNDSMVTLPAEAQYEFIIPWRAREITPFDEQMDALAEPLFPFYTVEFISGMTEIPLKDPPGVSPLEFKICALTPNQLISVVVEGEGTFAAQRMGMQKSYPWGMSQAPALLMRLLEQKRVSEDELIEEEVVLRYEICERFCDFPFTNQENEIFPSWSAEIRCQSQDEP